MKALRIGKGIFMPFCLLGVALDLFQASQGPLDWLSIAALAWWSVLGIVLWVVRP